jgi:hypothetical protein
MATIVTINSVTSGTSPYDIWVCDTCYGTCQYINTTSTIPYTFTLPAIYETYGSYVVKIIDDNGCVYCDSEIFYKQFQNSDLFEFMDGVPYEFQ